MRGAITRVVATQHACEVLPTNARVCKRIVSRTKSHHSCQYTITDATRSFYTHTRTTYVIRWGVMMLTCCDREVGMDVHMVCKPT